MGHGLAGRHAVVTGGGRGIGAAVAAALAGHGARVTLLGRDLAALQMQVQRLGEAHAVPVDVTDPEVVTAAFAAAEQWGGPVDILVNNAGAAESAPLARTGLELWRRMLEVNLTGTFLCCRAVAPGMVARGFGRIVNIASTAALKGYAYTSAYCAAKHGALGLTRALAVELARTGVTVNAVCPGFTETGMVEMAIDNIVRKTGRTPEQARAELTRSNPQARLVRPDEVANAVAWLCLPGAEAVTGQAIVVAGGEVM